MQKIEFYNDIEQNINKNKWNDKKNLFTIFPENGQFIKLVY